MIIKMANTLINMNTVTFITIQQNESDEGDHLIHFDFINQLRETFYAENIEELELFLNQIKNAFEEKKSFIELFGKR